MKRNLLSLGIAVLCSAQISFAQTTETFESVTVTTPGTRPTTFISGGQSFTLTTNDCVNGGIFGIWIPSQTFTYCGGTSVTNGSTTTYGVGTSCTGGTCTGTSAQFIDNSNSSGVSQIYSIKTTSAALFTVKSMFVFLSEDNAATPSATGGGGVTIRGKVAGSTVFTYTKTTGFTSSFSTNNGFNYIDFSAGTDFTSTNIDELEIQGGSLANYVAVDNFRWGPSVALPLGLLAFHAQERGGNVDLNWTAAHNAAIHQYQIEKSNDGQSFTTLKTVDANTTGIYSYRDEEYLEQGSHLYRLKLLSQNGESSYSETKNVLISTTGTTTLLYPNPTSGLLSTNISGTQIIHLQIMDITGRLVQIASLSAGANSMDISQLKTGVYFYKAMDAASGKMTTVGKINKL